MNLSNGNVGIGTTGPTTKLGVAGGVQISGTGSPTTGVGLEIVGGATPFIQAYNRDTPGYLPLNVYGSTFAFNPSVSGVFHITNAGNVGIGTTAPKATLHVSPGVIRIGVEIGLFETTAASSVACDTACSNDVTSYGGFNAGSGSCLKAWNDNDAGTLACASTSAVTKHCLCTGGY